MHCKTNQKSTLPLAFSPISQIFETELRDNLHLAWHNYFWLISVWVTLTCFPCHRRVWENVMNVLTVFSAVWLNICLFCLAHTLLHRSVCKHRTFERLLELLKWWHSRPEISLLICITWNIFSTNGTDGAVCTHAVVLNVLCMLCQTWTEMLFFVRAIN